MNRFEVAHQVGLVPALATLAHWQRTPFAYRLVALAFGMSWVGDSAARLLGGAWSASYWWLPIQFALVLVAVKPDLLVLWALALAAIASWLMSAPGPDWFLTLVGSCLVLTFARGRIALPLWIYFGAGSVAYSWMLATMESGILPAWYLYQWCRLTAFGAFVFMLHREAGHGRGSDRDPAGAARTAGLG
jgi:hypothetical protein